VQRPEETALSQQARVSAVSPMFQPEAVTGFWTMQEANLGSEVLAAQAAMAFGGTEGIGGVAALGVSR
jgi:hypothetical protein